MRKRALYAGVPALSVATAVLAVAATLGGISTDDLGADDANVTACDTDGVTTTYTVSYEASIPGYEVATVTVGGIADACNGQTMTVTLVDSANASLGEGSVSVAVDSGAGDSSDDVSLAASNIPVESVEGIHVTISG